MSERTPKKRVNKAAITIRGKWRSTFLKHLAENGVVGYAVKAAGVSRWAAYERRQRDAEFAKQWEQALESATDRLEQEAVRRAVDGVDEPVFYLGEECGKIRKYSDTLLIFLLKANRDKFRQANMPPMIGQQNNIQVNSYTVVEDTKVANVDPQEFELPILDPLARLQGQNGNGHANGNGVG